MANFGWGCNFGSPGSMNHLKILDTSSIMKRILEGSLLPNFELEVSGRMRRIVYYCVDGIYPKYAIFIDTIPEAISKMEKNFSAAQEALRKDVEPAFGALIWRWRILQQPLCGTGM